MCNKHIQYLLVRCSMFPLLPSFSSSSLASWLAAHLGILNTLSQNLPCIFFPAFLTTPYFSTVHHVLMKCDVSSHKYETQMKVMKWDKRFCQWGCWGDVMLCCWVNTRFILKVMSRLISQSSKCISRKMPCVSQICKLYSLLYKVLYWSVRFWHRSRSL